MRVPLIDRYTNEEFSVLEEVLAAYTVTDPPLHLTWSARDWLESFNNMHQEYLIKHLDDPLEDMPLLINHDFFFLRVIALWRLKIAR
jgi:hypothetical protein